VMLLAYEDATKEKNLIECTDLNRSGLPRIHTSPFMSAMTRVSRSQSYKNYNPHFPFIINTANINVDVNLKKYIIPVGVGHHPTDWTGYQPHSYRDKNLFAYLNEKYLIDLRDNNAILLLDQCHEGYQTKWLWEFFHTECARLQIPLKNIIYVTGNLTVEEHYDSWLRSQGLVEKILVIGYAHFEALVYQYSLNNLLPSFDDQLDYKRKNYEVIKTFSCFNKRPRHHRVWFYLRLFQQNLLENGLISMNEFGNHVPPMDGLSPIQEFIEAAASILPLKIYETSNNELDDSVYIRRFNEQACLDTWFTIISESSFDDLEETVFLSEKTFKPIACSQPFAFLGSKHSLRELKKLGYKTFDTFLDERYDSLSNFERINVLLQNITNVNSIPEKIEWFENMRYVIEHNKKQLEINGSKAPVAFVKIVNHYIETLGIL